MVFLIGIVIIVFAINLNIFGSELSSSEAVNEEIFNVKSIDNTPPSCIQENAEIQLSQEVIVLMQDDSGGLDTIKVLDSNNAHFNFPEFDIGTNEPVTITISKVDQSSKMWVKLEGIDISSNKVECTITD